MSYMDTHTSRVIIENLSDNINETISRNRTYKAGDTYVKKLTMIIKVLSNA